MFRLPFQVLPPERLGHFGIEAIVEHRFVRKLADFGFLTPPPTLIASPPSPKIVIQQPTAR